MKESINNHALWNNAGKAGAILGLVSAAYIPFQNLPSGFWFSALSLILWAAKFVGCILLMRFFMMRLSRNYAGVTNSVTMKYGVIIALLSALVLSAVYLVDILLIRPEMVEEQLNTTINSYAQFLDSNSMTVLEGLRDNYWQISFFSNLIYCFIYGVVLSAILSRNIPSRDPFGNFSEETGQTDEQ